MLAELELGAPRQPEFLLRATLPIPARIYPRDDGRSPFAIRDPLGLETPAQVEIVSRHARPGDGADVVEVIARVKRPKVASGQRIRYQVIWSPHDSSALAPHPEVTELVHTPGSVALRTRDVFGNLYTADLLGDLREDHTDLRVLRDGQYALQVRTHEVLLPAPAVDGPEGTLPHHLGVHAFVTVWEGEPFLSIDLRVHNGGNGRDPADPTDDALGDVYFDALELDVPTGWRVLQAFNDPTEGKPHAIDGVRRHPLIEANADGSMHFMPSQGSLHRRLVIVRGDHANDALLTLKERNLAFVRSSLSDDGQPLWSWWNPGTPGYFPQKHNLPELWHLPRAQERAYLEDLLRPYEENLEAGTVGPYPVVVGNLGWAHPWGVQPGYAHGGQEIHLYDGLRTAWAGSVHGYRYFQLVSRMSAERHAITLFDGDGDAITEEDWILDGPNGPYMPIYLWMWPILEFTDPFGLTSTPDFQRQAVADLGLEPDYQAGLEAFSPHDTQHLIRHTRGLKVLAWLGNDALAKDDLRLQAELARLSYSPYPQTPDGLFIYTGMGRDEQIVAEFPHQGFYIDRGEGWLIDAVAASYSLGDEEWRARVRPWFERIEALVADGISTCTGGIGSLIGEQGEFSNYRVRQSISEAILQNGLWSMRRSVFHEGEAPHARIGECITRASYHMISDQVWNEEAHAPWFYIALAPQSLQEPEFCTYTPVTDNVDAYQTWCTFAYGYELTGDPQFLWRAEEMLGEPLTTPGLGSGSYGYLENRAALMALVQALYE